MCHFILSFLFYQYTIDDLLNEIFLHKLDVLNIPPFQFSYESFYPNQPKNVFQILKIQKEEVKADNDEKLKEMVGSFNITLKVTRSIDVSVWTVDIKKQFHRYKEFKLLIPIGKRFQRIHEICS